MKLDFQLEERLKRGKLSHAYIITGDNRKELADYLAAGYVCTSQGARPCGICSGCRKAAAGIHPDIIRTGQNGETLRVDDIRELRKDAYIRPNEAPRKVYLLENAPTINAQGQNALLKLLEDGPDYAAFLFLTPNPELLLPTVRSRCETLRGLCEETAQAADQEGETLARLILDGEPLALAEYSVGLEKQSREEITFLLDQAMEKLVAQLPGKEKSLLPVLDRMNTLRAACEFNVGTGHLAGWLATVLTEP